jgi:hypothetical protein
VSALKLWWVAALKAWRERQFADYGFVTNGEERAFIDVKKGPVPSRPSKLKKLGVRQRREGGKSIVVAFLFLPNGHVKIVCKGNRPY